MAKRKEPKKNAYSNKKIIESTNPKLEHSYIKFVREPLIPVTKRSAHYSVESDSKKISKESEKRGNKSFGYIHEHPYDSKRWKEEMYAAFPSGDDLRVLDRTPIEKYWTIVQRDESTGEVMGTTMIFRKPSERGGGYGLRKWESKEQLEKAIKDRKEAIKNYEENIYTRGTVKSTMENLNRISNLTSVGGIRFHASPGYRFNKFRGNYEKKQHNLEGAVASVLIGSIILFLMIKTPLTGSVISNVESSYGFGIGLIIFLIALFGAGVYFLLKPYKKK